MSALNIGITGLQTASKDLGTISNNIANSNTVGYKSLDSQFADLYTGASGGGVYVSQVKQSFSQGSISYTTNSMDMAISGEGFFVMKDPSGENVYTRAGYFETDKNGLIVNNMGHKLQGFPVDNNGNVVTGSLSDLQADTSDLPSKPTGNVTIKANLDTREENINPVSTPFDSSDPDTYSYTTSSIIFDKQGNSHTATAYYVKTDDNTWNVHYQVDNVDVDLNVPKTDGTEGTETAGFTTLNFGESGELKSGGDFSLLFNTDATGDQIIDIDLTALTQFGNDSSVSTNSQDGYGAGQYTNLSVADDGSVFAMYNNGETRLLGVIALATFPNNNGLQPNGGTSWVATSTSGEPMIDQPGSAGTGSLVAGALEASNVDMTRELVDMVVAQSAYQASAKVVQAGDEMNQILMQSM
ncbi:flagellar hook protein FlgE [Endozoicomonas ascidiicola]|uniref:flagellar hook protein FlgE n=1 Tax=Endozoicomonas ascidiicola TaxID=1698521 RepID=UPI00082A2830|nr:flagellar hook protein FlgE [Endozoicomonas ascidiicola]